MIWEHVVDLPFPVKLGLQCDISWLSRQCYILSMKLCDTEIDKSYIPALVAECLTNQNTNITLQIIAWTL